ncbi:MAG: uroporphyrinogen decarboxylase family protein [Armatimonadota bacterium]
MTSLERTMTVITGGIPDRVPTDLHNFLMASRMAGIPLSECLNSGESMAEAQLVAWRCFKHDMLLVENGTTAVAQALGCGIAFSETVAPRILEPSLKSLSDIDRIEIPNPEEEHPMREVIEAVRILRKELGDRAFIMGRADQAPMALAAAIRGHESFWLDLGLCEDISLIERVLDVCTEVTIRYALALQEAGAHGTCIGEVGSDIVSPAMYRSLVLPRLKKFFSAMRRAGFPAALHQCGDSEAVLPEMVASGADILELDPSTSMKIAKQASMGKTTVLGMVDPANVLHRGTPELVERKSREALEVMAPGGGFILGPGCALMPETPEENVMALIETAREYGAYNPDGTLADSSDMERLQLI